MVTHACNLSQVRRGREDPMSSVVSDRLCLNKVERVGATQHKSWVRWHLKLTSLGQVALKYEAQKP